MFRGGFLNFMRNGMVSLSSILVMTITLSLFSGILFFEHILKTTLANVENKVDVTAYIIPGSSEDAITALKSKIEVLPEVAEVTYVSEHDALEQFRERHASDETTLQALDELDENPIGAMLNIRAKEISQYESISKFFDGATALGAGGGASIVDHVDYNRNKDEISAIQNILSKGRLLGLILTLVLVALSVVVTFNTSRLAIYFAREEIAVMRLVGASKLHAQGPFIVEGALYGAAATIITLILYIPITLWFGARMTDFFQGLNLFTYYMSHIFQFFIILLFFGGVVGALSSMLAVRRYLRI
jgi:cell division transport system permease protein